MNRREFARLLAIGGAACLAAAFASASSAIDPVEPNTTVRRICVQMGVQTYRAPDKKERIARGTATLSARLEGGAYVQITGPRVNGYVQVKPLKGDTLWVPQTDPESGHSSLCTAPPLVMRACRKDRAPQDIPVQEDFEIEGSPTVAVLRRGSLVQLWEHFEDHGRWAFVEKGGKVGFVRSEELCHEASAPPGSDASVHFHMTVAPARTDCYQSGRERETDEIRRIIIHNTENTMKSAIAMFQGCDPTSPTSAHVGIDRDGRMYRFVEDKFAAFHTGGNNGGFNAMSLGIEVVASDKRDLGGLTPQQERSLVALIRFWAKQYRITIPAAVLGNSTRSKTYNNLEFWEAPVTIHRLASPGRGTDCPKFIWADSLQGDEDFFRWRRTTVADEHFEADR